MIGVIPDYQEENIDILLPEDNMPTSLASHLDDLCVFFEHAEQSISCGDSSYIKRVGVNTILLATCKLH